MAATEAINSFGVLLKKGNADGPPETFTDFGLEIISVDGVAISRDSIEATHSQSPGQYRERIAGTLDAGGVTVAFNFIPANASDIVDEIEGAAANWQIAFPDSSTLTVKAFFTNFAVGSMTVDGKMEATAVITVTGQPTWA